MSKSFTDAYMHGPDLTLAAEAYESGEYMPNLGWSKTFFFCHIYIGPRFVEIQ